MNAPAATAPAVPSAVGLDARVAFERIRSLYRNVPAAFIAAMTVSFYLVGTSWTHVDHRLSLGWLALMLAMQGLRFGAWFAYRRATPDPAATGDWARRYQIFIGLSGCVWGASPFLFIAPGDPITHAMVMMGMYGLGAGVVPGLAYLPSALRLFLLLVFVPLVLRLLLLGGFEYVVLAVATFLFMGVLIGFGRNTARTIEEAIRIRFENLELLEQVRREKDLADAARRRAEQANRAKSQFFAAASHDLRQPLHALGLYSSSLQDTALPAQVEIVERVSDCIEALESLFDGLLDLSKLDAGVIHPQAAHFKVGSLLDDMRTQFAGTAREKGLRMRIRDCGAVLHTDPFLLGRITSNLIANAVRYTEQGGVLVCCRRRAGRVRLEIRDSGIGIPQEQHGRIFEEFYQLQNAERDRRKGLGLGLATVRRLSELLELRLTLASRVGRGSVFAIEVPLGDPAQVQLPVPPAAIRDVLHGKRILVIDDEMTIRDGMQTLLMQWHCVPIVAVSVDEALLRLNGSAPDLIIADYRLGGGANGVDAVRQLHQALARTVPSLLITGDTAPERLREARSTGWQVLHKPVRPVQLRAACNHLLSVDTCHEFAKGAE